MTIERYNYLLSEIEKIRVSERLADEETQEQEMFLFKNREEWDDFMEIENGISKPITKQDILEEMADEKYNVMMEV